MLGSRTVYSGAHEFFRDCVELGIGLLAYGGQDPERLGAIDAF